MKLFGLFRRRKAPDEEIFLDLNNPSHDAFGSMSVNGTCTLADIYDFLQFDYEPKGYNDALTTPDDSYRTENLNLLNKKLDILINKCITYYETKLMQIDFHIASRTRAGLIDHVEELKTNREIVENHLSKTLNIKAEAENGSGMAQCLKLSYSRGFMKGLSALSQSDTLNIKL